MSERLRKHLMKGQDWECARTTFMEGGFGNVVCYPPDSSKGIQWNFRLRSVTR